MSEPEVRLWRVPEYVGSTTRGAPLTAAQLATIEERAYEEGLQRGLEEGRARGAAEVRSQAARLQQVLESIEPQSNVLDDTMLEQLGVLVLAIARQFVRREIAREPGEIVRVVREALGALPVSGSTVRVLLHPDDARLVSSVMSADTMSQPIRIIEDPAISRGGARIETDVSIVDATVEARFGALAATIFGDERHLTPDAPEPT